MYIARIWNPAGEVIRESYHSVEVTTQKCIDSGRIPMVVKWQEDAPNEGLFERKSLLESHFTIPFQEKNQHWLRIVQMGQEKGGDTLIISAHKNIHSSSFEWVWKHYREKGLFSEVIFVIDDGSDDRIERNKISKN